ncbi:MAG TPA: MG2 domain-containing protein, partial [Steroidobacteraceae bacterium]|nr:MG2 domain-containing protein [Steroidobacteraceae bacterium]
MKLQERINSLTTSIGHGIAKLWGVITPPLIFIWKALFGAMSWQPPGWIQWTGRSLSNGYQRTNQYLQEKPKQAAIISGTTLLIVAAGIGGWLWYKAQPKPIEVSFTVTAPAITCYSCEPQGRPNALRVHFNDSVAPVELTGHVLDMKKSKVSIDPVIAGEWRWEDDRTLTFQPSTDWGVGQQYDVTLARKSVVAPHIRLDKYSFDFKSAEFEAKVVNTEFYQDPEVAANKKVVVNVHFTHPVDPEKFEKRIAIKMFNRETDTREVEVNAPHYSVVYDKIKLNAFIHSDKLDVPPKEGRLAIDVDSGVQSARGGNKTDRVLHSSVIVPGLNSLKISDVSLNIARDERNEPQQVLTIVASHSVLERDMPAKVKAWLLPIKHPDPKRQAQYAGNRPFYWNSSTVTPDVIAASTVLDLKQDPGELEHYETHGFRYKADPGRYIYVKVEQGLKSFGGYILGNTTENILQVPEFPRELQLLHQGSLLALSGDKRVTFFSRNVPAIKVDVSRVLPKQIQYLVTQTSGNFSQPQFQSWAFRDADITEHFSKIIKLPATAPGESHYEAVDLGEYLENDGRGVFLLRAQAWDVEHNNALSGGESSWGNASTYNLSDARLIVVTDLGLLVKRANDGSQDVFVQSIKNGEPVSGVTVDVLGRNGLPVMSEVSGGDGHVRFADFNNLRNEKQAVVYLAHRGSDSSFMPVDQRDRMLDMSRFDVGGVSSSTDKNALTAYLFSDRGLYRPGESIHVANIVRSQNWSRSLNNVPLIMEVTDPRGTTIRREIFSNSATGFNEIAQDTKLTSLAGTYTFSVSTVRNNVANELIGSTTVQVRDFQPDRLRMSTHFSNTLLEGWVSPDKLNADVQLNNLFGTPAQQRRVTASMTLSPALPAFRNYADYQFYDPQYAKEGFTEELNEATTDDQGHATLNLNLQRFAKATYRVHLVTQGFEADGGRGVTAEATQLVSNMPYLLGYKADGDLSFVSRNAERKVSVIAIDPELKRHAVSDLKVSRIELKYVSVLMRQSSGVFKYESRRKEVLIETQPLNIAATGTALTLATDAPGNFAYVIRDANDQSLARIEYQVAGDANVTRRLEKNAELEINLSKPDYASGEDIELSIRAPYAGAGLITIERERVVAWKW